MVLSICQENRDNVGAKFVPILGGVISDGLTLAMFKPMAHMLKKHLSTMAHMSPEEFAEYEAAIVFGAKDSDIDGEIVEVVLEEVATNYWVCTSHFRVKYK